VFCTSNLLSEIDLSERTFLTECTPNFVLHPVKIRVIHCVIAYLLLLYLVNESNS